MAARRPGTVALVCAAHALLAWALLSLGSSRPSSAWPPRPDTEPGVVTVVLHTAPVELHTTPMELHTTPMELRLPPPGLRKLPPALPALAPAVEAPAPVLQALAPLPAADAAPASAPAMPTEAPAPERPAAPPAAAAARAALPALTPAPPPTPAPPRTEPPTLVRAHADRQRCPPAPHPAALRERGIEGAVLLRVRVDVQGRPADVTVLAGSGWRLFDEAALQQVRACRFVPATQGGQAVDSWVEFPVRFALAG